MKYSADQYNEIFTKLPQEIRDVVATQATTEHLWKIGGKHELHIDKIGIMHDLSMDVMMGIIASKNFVRELQSELGIPALDASVLARDIDEEIFKPIKSTMIKIYGDGAPYKPSSTLVQFYEEEDEHPNLDRDALLKEIENPSEAVVRRDEVKKSGSEEVKTTSIETADEVKELKEMEKKAGINVQKPIEIKKIGMHLEKAPPPEGGLSSTLDKIASLKLSQTFVMPKGSDTSSIASIEQKINNPFLEEKKAPPLPKPVSKAPPASAIVKPESAPYTPPAPKNYGADPYREPLA